MNMHFNTENSIAILSNVVRLSELITKVASRTEGLLGMATFHGPSGYGKSTAMIWCVNRHDCYHVAMRSVWARKAFCEAILREMRIPPEKTVAKMVEQIATELAATGKVLMIDEADFLAKKSMIEIVRDIYELSGGGIILIGEESLPKQLAQWERVHNRMMAWFEALPASIDDANRLAEKFCTHLSLDEDVLLHTLERSGARPRRIRVNLENINDFARKHGIERISADHIPEIEFFTGEAPTPRRV